MADGSMKPKDAAELISKSFDSELSESETADLNEHLKQDPDSMNFAKTAKTVHRVIGDISEWTTTESEIVGPELSPDAKVRLSDSIVQAVSAQIMPEVDVARQKAEKVLALAGDHASDLAFASIAFQSGLISNDWLERAAESWDRENQSFSDHLVNEGLLNSEQKQRIESQAAEIFGKTLAKDQQETLMIDKTKSKLTSSNLESSAVMDDELLTGLGKTMGLSTASMETEIQKPGGRQVESRFTLIRKLGEGGLGRVWLARDEQLKRMVAIKETNEISAKSKPALERFRREAEITGRLEHPNIVPLYQFGNDAESNQPFYAMRFLGKRNLSEAIAEFHERNQGELEKVGLHKLLTAFVGICQAIGYAHSRGVIHRDLKPDNVALDSFGQVIVLDWGLAKIVEESELHQGVNENAMLDDQAFNQTIVGQIIGTPMYMAPEQAVGDHDQVDEKTDVYGLGAILFSILTGLAPHENSVSSTPSGTGTMKALLKAIASNPTPSPTTVNSKVPRDLERICMNAMAKKRHGRYASVTELAEEIQLWMAGQDDRRQRFDNMRMSGRELKVNVSASVRDLATNARFMSILPPIQEIINVYEKEGKTDDVDNDWWKSNDEMQTWRERLRTILRGLLQANSDYQAVSYCNFGKDSFSEIVRVERHSTDRSNIRVVPSSRLSQGLISKFAINVMKQKPDEVFISITSQTDEHCENCDELMISAGVPVFDETNEEPFGFVVIETRFQDLVEHSFRISGQNYFQLLVLDDDQSIIYHRCKESGQISCSFGKKLQELYPVLEPKSASIFRQEEFIDELDRQVYAMQISLGHRGKKLTFVFLQLDVQHG